MTATVDRDRLLAWRILTSGLSRHDDDDAGSLRPVLALGVQDRDGGAALALADRHPDPPTIGAPGDDTALAQAWTLRGTPHVHLRDDLPGLADALRPTSEAEAVAMLAGSGRALAAQGTRCLDALDVVAGAMRRLVTRPTPKAELSTALTAALDPRYVTFCAPCGVDHVPELLFRTAALPAGLGLVPGRPATLEPLRPVPSPAEVGRDHLVTGFLDLYGAATRAEVAAHLGTRPGNLPWPGTTPLTVDGERLQTTPDRLDRITATDPADVTGIVRLLPPGDPLLQPRTRSLTVPDRAYWTQLWPAIGPAGALLAGGGIAGTWRPRTAAGRLTVTVRPFRALTPAERRDIAAEAELVARVRGATDVALVLDA